jgi:hypothetical protein
VLRLAELAARECDGKDAFSVPVLIAAFRQRRLEIKMREIGSCVGPVADYGWMTGNPEVVPGQKSAWGKSPSISSKPV